MLLKYKYNTGAMCEWRLNCGKYVINGTDWQLVCYSNTFCNQYIASVYYRYKTFCQFFPTLYSTQTSHCFCKFFKEAYCQYLVTQASLWHHNSNQDVTKEAAVTMVCGHAIHSGCFMSDFLFIHTRISIVLICLEASWSKRNWHLDFGHCGQSWYQFL